MRDQDAPPSEIVIANYARSNERADQDDGSHDAQNGQIELSGSLVLGARAAEKKDGDDGEETELDQVVQRKREKIGEGEDFGAGAAPIQNGVDRPELADSDVQRKADGPAPFAASHQGREIRSGNGDREQPGREQIGGPSGPAAGERGGSPNRGPTGECKGHMDR